MVLPCNNLFSGRYVVVFDKDYVDGLVRAGLPKNDGEKLVGASFVVVMKANEDTTKLTVKMSSADVPEYNDSYVLYAGRATPVTAAMFGGKGSATFRRVGDSRLEFAYDMEAAGRVEFVEDYCAQGLVSVCRWNGQTMTARARREPLLTGWFKFSHAKNVEAYCQATGQPLELLDALKESKWHMEKHGDVFVSSDFFGAVVARNEFRLNEEWQYSFPGFPQWDRDVVTVEVPNGIRFIAKDKVKDRIEDTTVWFDEDGAAMYTVDRASGQYYYQYMERFNNIYGKWKLVSSDNDNMAKMFEMIGMPPEAAKAAANEADVYWVSKPTADGGFHFNYHSKLIPMDVCVTPDEEYYFSMPGSDEKFLSIDTICGNEHIALTKTPNGTMKTHLRYMDTFTVQTVSMVGQDDLCAKMVFMRV